MAFLRELMPWRAKAKDIALPTWQEALYQFDIAFLSDYYRLPTGEQILNDFVGSGQTPIDYPQFCDTNLRRISQIRPLLEAESDRLWQKERPARLKDKLLRWEGSCTQVSDEARLAGELATILNSPAGPATFLITSTLRELYYRLPDTHLAPEYNPVHDFDWHGIALEGNTQSSPHLFMERIFREPYIPHPNHRDILTVDHQNPEGNPMPAPEAEVRYRKGCFGSPDYYDVIITMDLRNWFSLTINSYNAASFDREDRREDYNAAVPPMKFGNFSGKKDPEGFIQLLQSYGKLLTKVYRVLPRQLASQILAGQETFPLFFPPSS